MKKFVKQGLVILPILSLINLQLFADGDTVINGTDGYYNNQTGGKEAFTSTQSLSSTMKTYYDTSLLENARANLIHAQFGQKQPLPAGRGKTVEWRKWNTLGKALTPLTEGVTPTGKKLSQTLITESIKQYGDYVTISDQLELHALDPVLVGATEELGAAAGATEDTLVRNVLIGGTNVMYAEKKATGGALTAITSRWKLDDTCKLTPDTVNKAATKMKKDKVPLIDGKLIAIIHPSVTYDLRSSDEWLEAHKYAATREIFNGEIGEIHNTRFMETTEAKVISAKPLFSDAQRYLTVAAYSAAATASATVGNASAYMITVDEVLTEDIGKALVGRYVLLEDTSASGAIVEKCKIIGTAYASKYLFIDAAPTTTPADGDYLCPGEAGNETHAGEPNAVYLNLFLGKDAYGLIDPDGAGMEMIIHDKNEAGGPLNQRSTAGYKFSQATKILYQERILRVESGSAYSHIDEDN